MDHRLKDPLAPLLYILPCLRYAPNSSNSHVLEPVEAVRYWPAWCSTADLELRALHSAPVAPKKQFFCCAQSYAKSEFDLVM
jgi:hypothetical protein